MTALLVFLYNTGNNIFISDLLYAFQNRSYVKQGRMVKVVWEFKGWVGKRPAQQPWFDLGYLNQALLVL